MEHILKKTTTLRSADIAGPAKATFVQYSTEVSCFSAAQDGRIWHVIAPKYVQR